MSESPAAKMDIQGNVVTEKQRRVGKRMAYLLRYGAEREGLQVHEGGYVQLMDLLRVPMMKHHEPYDVLKEITESKTTVGTKRFEKKLIGNAIYVRAIYGRRMERNPNHEGSQVTRLLEICMDYVCDHLREFDLDGFPDEFILNGLLHKLKRSQRLNNKAFRAILGHSIEHLDLGAVYLTETTIKLVAQRCPNLRVLNLRGSGYVLNDHYMEILLKPLHQLESINLAGCRHLTDRTVRALCRRGASLRHVNLSHAPEVSQEAVLRLLADCPRLHHLDIFNNANITHEGLEILREYVSQRKVYIVLDGIDVDVHLNASRTLALASVGKCW